jgi:hypothetical protein
LNESSIEITLPRASARGAQNGAPVTFGHFEVVTLTEYRVPRACGDGLMLDYGRGGNRVLDVIGLLRDPIVAVTAGDPTLLLGWSYLDLGLCRLGTPSFFLLDRERPLEHEAAPPRVRHA